MKLDEHTSKALFAEVGIPVPRGIAIDSTAQIKELFAASEFPLVVKAQVLSGGRGKAGGVKVVNNMTELKATARALLSMRIADLSVPYLRIEPAATFSKEFYVCVYVHRETQSIILACNRRGGVEVESSTKEGLIVQKVDLFSDSIGHTIQTAFFLLGLPRTTWSQFLDICTKLISLVRTHGILLAEINPLVLTDKTTLLALDGKVDIDDSMTDLHPERMQKYDRAEHLTGPEHDAKVAGLSYHRLKGWVGMMVNGAGLAMNTMDVLNMNGLPAANFLDLGGGADVPRMQTGLRILMEDDRVRVIFINIFGGILSCANVAEALIKTLEHVDLSKPAIVRFSGFMAEEGRTALLATHNTHLSLVSNMAEALDTLAQLAPEIPTQTAPLSSPSQSTHLHGDTVTTSLLPLLCPKPHAYAPAKANLGLDTSTQVVVQGITGKTGRLHTRLMREFGTNIVAGVTPFKGGTEMDGIPVYNTVHEACCAHTIGASVIFVPAGFAPDAILSAADENIPWIVCITEGIPQAEMLRVKQAMRTSTSKLVGPNTPGIVIPETIKLGIMPGMIFKPGPVAVFSRSGTLTYETVDGLTRADIGQSICAGIGGDPFIGNGLTEFLELVRHDGQTRAVLVLGEIGGDEEERMADYITTSDFPLPVVGFIAGRTAPPGKRFGHAGAILSKGGGEVENKMETMRAAGVQVCSSLEEAVLAITAIFASE